jgi:hypothetical protein
MEKKSYRNAEELGLSVEKIIVLREVGIILITKEFASLLSYTSKKNMLDGIIITERGTKTEKVLYARQTPTLLTSLNQSFKQKHRKENQPPSPAISNASLSQPTKRRSMSTSMQLTSNRTPVSPQTIVPTAVAASVTSQSDFVHSNISWAESILMYVKKVQKGCLPIVDGSFLVLNFMNNRLIVFTMVGSIGFYVIGDDDHEYKLRDIGKNVVEACKSACKRTPDDPEAIVKNYAKLCVLLDRVLCDETTDTDATIRSIHELVD